MRLRIQRGMNKKMVIEVEYNNSGDSDKPAMKFKDRGLELAVWANNMKQSDGTTKVIHSFTIQKNFLDRDGNWQSNKNFNPGDLLGISELFLEAHRKINIKFEIMNSFE